MGGNELLGARLVLAGFDKGTGPWRWDLLGDSVFELVLYTLKRGLVVSLHVAPPCSSFSAALRSKARLRSAEPPEGPEAEVQSSSAANELAQRSATCCSAQAATGGGWWNWGNPVALLMWGLPEVARLKRDAKKVVFDQYRYGARRDLDPICQRTTVLGNRSRTEALRRMCVGSYAHLVLAGMWCVDARQPRLPRTLSAAACPSEL